jgi:alpha-mannosidase
METAGAALVRQAARPAILEAALQLLDAEFPAVAPELAAEFFALGLCHLQVELLTRQLRYMSNLDEIQFRQRTLAAAEAVETGASENARDYLRSAFDLLTESREYFFPIEAHLLDLTLVATTTLGPSLRAELAGPGLVNLLLDGETLEVMAQREPESLVALREALEKQRATIVGGLWQEDELPLLPPEAVLAQLRRGLSAYQQHLGCRPTIFARRRFGLSPLLPQVLRKLGFLGAFHFTLDDGRFPTGNQSKIRWEGLDGTPLEAAARLPLDAARADCFLQLPETLGHILDLDHAATLIFAHWPNQASCWYDDLRRTAEYSPALGRFNSVTEYFRSTEYAGQTIRHKADQYRSPYLRQDVAADRVNPISRWSDYHRRRVWAETIAALAVLAQLIRGKTDVPATDLLEEVEAARDATPEAQVALDQRLDAELLRSKTAFAEALPRSSAPARDGCLVVNPWSFAARQWIETPALEHVPALGGAVWKTAEVAEKKEAIVDLPALGFAWLEAGPAPVPAAPEPRRRRDAKPQEPPLAEEHTLRNELFQVQLNPLTGAIQSIHDLNYRGNRLAQQIAYRSPHPARSVQGDESESAEELHYTIMAADEIAVTSSGPLVGQIVSRGRLMTREGEIAARFSQKTTIQRGSRVLTLEIDLEPLREPEPDPWNSYYAVRFAWGDPLADLVRSVHLTSQPTEIAQLEAPHFIDLRSEKTRTTILTGGLPYHRHFGPRKLDSLLVVHGETARRFRLGIGVDLLHSVPAALHFLAPAVVIPQSVPPSASSGWLFHINAKNVLATAWEPVAVDGGISGFRVRLLETEGRRSQVTLRCFRPVRSARKLDFLGAEPIELLWSEDQITLDLGPHEWSEVEGEFGE